MGLTCVIKVSNAALEQLNRKARSNEIPQSLQIDPSPAIITIMQHTETDFALDGAPMILLYSLDLLCLPKHRLLAINIPSHIVNNTRSIVLRNGELPPRQILDKYFMS